MRRLRAAAGARKQSTYREHRGHQHAQSGAARQATVLSAAGSWKGGFITTQSAQPAVSPTGANASADAVTSRQTAVALSANPLRAMFCAASVAKQRVHFDQRQPDTRYARRDCKPRGAHARAQFNDMIAGARRCRRSQQDCIVTEAMTLARLQQVQTAPERGVVGNRFRQVR